MACTQAAAEIVAFQLFMIEARSVSSLYLFAVYFCSFSVFRYSKLRCFVNLVVDSDQKIINDRQWRSVRDLAKECRKTNGFRRIHVAHELTGIIHMLHDPIHCCLDAGVVGEVNAFDAGIAGKAHVNELTNNRLVHVNSCLTHNARKTLTHMIRRPQHVRPSPGFSGRWSDGLELTARWTQRSGEWCRQLQTVF